MSPTPPEIPSPDLGWALSRTVRAPLDGLRASIESLARALRGERVDPSHAARTLDAALEQVQRMARDVDALIAYAKPRPVAPLACTIDEILHATLSSLPADLRSRVRITCPAPGHSPWVDGPLLATSLMRILETSLESSGLENWVLLEVRRGDSEIQFRVFDGGSGSILGPHTLRGDTPRNAHLGLGESLAQRDLERMGASLALETVDGVAHLVVRVPDQGAHQKEGAA